MKENGKIGGLYSWPVIILAFCIFWPVGLFLLIKRISLDKPYVSIIVPVYNVEKYLEKCLDSLVNQTLKNIEIIIVNDGTKDNSQDIVDKYTKKYENMIQTTLL